MSGSMDARRRFEQMNRLIAQERALLRSQTILFCQSINRFFTRPIAPGNGSDSQPP